MTAPRNRRHILVRKEPTTEKYTPHRKKIVPPIVPAPTSRAKHAAALESALQRARTDAEQRRTALNIQVHGAEPGIYVQFESAPGIPLKVDTLENKTAGIELVAVQEVLRAVEGDKVQLATVFVPDGALNHFVKRFEQYASEKTLKGEARHKDSVDRIAILRLATLEALWTDAAESFPELDERVWWEVWLRKHDGHEYERLVEFAGLANFEVGDRRLEFEDRLVVLAYANAKQLSGSLDVLSDFAEVRLAKQSAAPFVDSSPSEQAEWVEELLARTTPPADEAPSVCVLDTGVNRAHPLLEIALLEVDAGAVDPAWGPHDDGGGPEAMGHGTEMAGLALYGDLSPVLSSTSPVRLQHRLESMKILPPHGENKPELYGAITAEAAYRSETAAPQRRRTFSLAVSAPDSTDRGIPTSWSAAIDALASGRSFDPGQRSLTYLDANADVRRLFVVAAGNVSVLEVAHLDRSDTESIQDPGQAWNALTVGAFTEKAHIQEEKWRGLLPVAKPGDLSPWSTTGVTFGEGWPMKPEVVLEGGNIAHDGKGGVESTPIPDLRLLTTHYRASEKLFVLSWATSAATAQASRLASIISAEYPAYWPETIRALIVHSARWTPAMTVQLDGAAGKTARARLLRRYGFGVPSFQRALRSAQDALTLIVQGSLKPFADGKFNEVHFHELPWPKEVLAGLGQVSVRLRVTLSYFIEPNPGRRGWKTRHRYASHGLRFDVRKPTESLKDFRKRVNERALDDGEERPPIDSDSSDWFLGERARNRGSIHSDIWSGSAADLAERGVIAVFPVAGWWKDQRKHDRSKLGARYSLVLSIETDAETADIWTPVATEVGIPIEAALEVVT